MATVMTQASQPGTQALTTALMQLMKSLTPADAGTPGAPGTGPAAPPTSTPVSTAAAPNPFDPPPSMSSKPDETLALLKSLLSQGVVK